MGWTVLTQVLQVSRFGVLEEQVTACKLSSVCCLLADNLTVSPLHPNATTETVCVVPVCCCNDCQVK